MAPKSKSRSGAAAAEARNDGDAVMEDAPTSAQPPPVGGDEDHPEGDGQRQLDEEDEEEEKRVKMLPGSSPTAASFEFLKEGHTLGNALSPEVEFCAYAIPHPSEAKMNLRIQTYEGTTAIEALEKGLKDLQDLCDVVTDKFTAAREDFASRMHTDS